MRQAMRTAGSMRARLRIGAIGALLLSVAPAQAQPTPPDAATKAAMDKRTAARNLLSSALARIGSNGSDATALLDAGRTSIDLDDYRAAVGFLVRAEQARPRDGAIKAALGSAMVHMENPTRALDYFGEAQLLGAPERLFLADRGLARDLLGQQDAAQRDYQLALSMTPGDELTRRYALSLGISGEADRAIQLLTPQLRAQDRGAWRLRAMILAMNGRDAEASEIVNATMPPAMAQNILPYLTQMDRLNPAQQAAAAHFGRFPTGRLGPKRQPVQVAAATPPAAPAAAGKRTAASAKRPGTATTVAAATPKPALRPVGPAFARPREPVARDGQAVAAAAAPPQSTRVAATPAPAAANPAATAAPTLQAPVRDTIRPATVAAAGGERPVAGTEAAAATPPVTSRPVAAALPAPPPSVGPGFTIADIGRRADTPPAATAVATPPATPVPAAPSASLATIPSPGPNAPDAGRPLAALASLADIVGSIEIPPEELNASANAIDAGTLAKLVEDKRRADAAEAARREKEAAAAKAKAEADAKATAEAAEKKAHPARIWVQVATGANVRALALDYAKFAKKSPELFKGQSGATAEWGRTRRLLVGPFKDRKAAQDWLGDYKKAGGDGFLFNSEAGETVDPVK
ncbi:MAG: SPOR domain-containing protein [Sphingopyxis sp.]|nr:SPOR domain-containing protein [Sphingopyxis sp.]